MIRNNLLTKKFFKLFYNPIFLIYMLGGVISTIVDILIFFIMTNFYIFNYMISNIVSFSCAVTTSFLYNRYITFQISKNNKFLTNFVIFFIISILSLGISSFQLYLFIGIIGLNSYYAKLLQIIISYPINFYLIRKVVFNVKSQ